MDIQHKIILPFQGVILEGVFLYTKALPLGFDISGFQPKSPLIVGTFTINGVLSIPIWVRELRFAQTHHTKQKLQKSHQANAPQSEETTRAEKGDPLTGERKSGKPSSIEHFHLF